MANNFYHNKLQTIKNSESKEFLSMEYENHDIVLKLIDNSEETIKLITKWRKLYRNNFGTDFQINEDKTKKWINDGVLSNIDKIVFVIYANKQKIGIISTSDYKEESNSAILDTMIKDPGFHLKGLMTTVEKVYLKWMFDELKLSKIRGFLFSDNEKMMKIHTTCGWKLKDVVPIKQIKTNEGTKWEIITSEESEQEVKRYYNLIELTKEDLMKNFNDIKYKILCD